jgi:hypothetical protein
LFDLIHFGFALLGLKVQDVFDAFFREDMVATAYSFIETEGAKQLTEWLIRNSLFPTGELSNHVPTYRWSRITPFLLD